MTRLTELGAMHLRNVYAADQQLRTTKASIKAQARDWANERLRSYQAAADLQVRLAINAGVPRSQILEAGLSTKSWSTLYESLARTEAVSADLAGQIEEPQATGPQFRRNDHGAILLTLLGDDFDKSAREHGWTETEINALHGAHDWQLDAEGGSIAENDFLPEFSKRHPTGAWHVRNIGIAREWAANN